MRNQTRNLLAVTVVLGSIHTAMAADLPVKAPAYPPPVVAAYNWTGFYVGGNLGYGWGSSSDPDLSAIDGSGSGVLAFFNAGGFPITAVNPKGVIGGGQVGYNWQPGSTWVFGLVTDFQGSGMQQDGTFVSVAPLPFIKGRTTVDRSIDWFGTLRGKLGWAQQNWLFYATGGLAYGHIKEDLTFRSNGIPQGRGSNEETRAGWTLGAGTEYAWGPWSLGLEYLYMDLGHSNAAIQFTGYPGANLDSVTVSSGNSINIVRALVNYRF